MEKEDVKMKVLQHLKALMEKEMSKDIPSHMTVEAVHKFPPETTLSTGEDECGNPMGVLEHEEGEEHIGMDPHAELPDLHELHSGTDKEMEDVESHPHMEVPLDESKHPLFAMAKKKEEDPEEGNTSFVSRLKREKKSKSKE